MENSAVFCSLPVFCLEPEVSHGKGFQPSLKHEPQDSLKDGVPCYSCLHNNMGLLKSHHPPLKCCHLWSGTQQPLNRAQHHSSWREWRGTLHAVETEG